MQENVFANLMVISASLALGLILGMTIVQVAVKVVACLRKFARRRCKGEKPIVMGSAWQQEATLTKSQADLTEAFHEREIRDEKERVAEERIKGMFTVDDEDPPDEESDDEKQEAKVEVENSQDAEELSQKEKRSQLGMRLRRVRWLKLGIKSAEAASKDVDRGSDYTTVPAGSTVPADSTVTRIVVSGPASKK